MPTAGLGMTSTAPSSSARIAVSVPRLRQRGADHDRDWIVGHDLAEERQTVHARHLEVEHDHVGPPLFHLAHRDQRMRRGVHMDTHLARQERCQTCRMTAESSTTNTFSVPAEGTLSPLVHPLSMVTPPSPPHDSPPGCGVDIGTVPTSSIGNGCRGFRVAEEQTAVGRQMRHQAVDDLVLDSVSK